MDDSSAIFVHPGPAASELLEADGLIELLPEDELRALALECPCGCQALSGSMEQQLCR